jgi:hypothetical protein
MKIRVLFYKAKVDGKLLDDAISIYTGVLPCNWGTEGYSHVEIWWPDDYGSFEIVSDSGNAYYVGECFSSTTRGQWKGVRVAPTDEVLKHPDRWDCLEMEVEDDLFYKAKDTIWSEIGKPYDHKGIFGFFWPWPVQDKNKWYCSEIVAFFLFLVKKLLKREVRISPRRLSKLLRNRYIIKPLVSFK